ncbi:MAG: precorrin-6Y C5,15-methyltransferase (decarboxylating) subunit CbiT [Halanaerobiales bacterium]
MKKPDNEIWDYTTGGIPDNKFLRDNVPMTKEEIRIITISKLRIKEDSIIYDIGAGTGSLTVETALRAKTGKVFAVEKEKNRSELIAKNVSKFGLKNVRIITGEAPSALKGLPSVDRVVIGGSGGKLEPILDQVDKKLKVAGRIVINAVTLNTLMETISILDEFNYSCNICQVAVTRTRDVADYKMLKALNPVYIISLQKEN